MKGGGAKLLRSQGRKEKMKNHFQPFEMIFNKIAELLMKYREVTCGRWSTALLVKQSTAGTL